MNTAICHDGQLAHSTQCITKQLGGLFKKNARTYLRAGFLQGEKETNVCKLQEWLQPSNM
jgi:hypothetical protein